jgi:antitoxin component of RelBE/YafQ-DinJ toxin-antitoxin module
MEITREHRDVLEAMGVALLVLQSTEDVLRLCMTFVIQKKKLTLESLQQQEEIERNKTIGYFLSQLRHRVSVHPKFDSLLKDFLKNRNDFVHNLEQVPGWSMKSSEGRAAAKKFIYLLIEQANKVQQVFVGLLLAWQEQTGISVPLPDHEWFSKVASAYKPLADCIFRAKDS